jgi:NAD(P)-dependent dehydrogenase (short-subunit alcohol dehydrogenase family)
MDLGITGLRVLVTAGANGIGRGIVEAFLAEGAKVYTCDVDAAGLATLPAGSWPPALPMSRTAPRWPRWWMRRAHLGGLDVLVNNAGIAGPTGKVEEINPEDWDRCLQVCLTSQFNLARLAVPHLREAAATHPSSTSPPPPGIRLRAAQPLRRGEMGRHRLHQVALHRAWRDGIRVNAILPGLVAGDRQRRVLEAKAQQRGLPFAEVEKAAFSYVSIKDYVTPQQLADQILLLASLRGRTTSGQAIGIDGDLQMLF